jgi:hypothetical protein
MNGAISSWQTDLSMGKGASCSSLGKVAGADKENANALLLARVSEAGRAVDQSVAKVLAATSLGRSRALAAAAARRQPEQTEQPEEGSPPAQHRKKSRRRSMAVVGESRSVDRDLWRSVEKVAHDRARLSDEAEEHIAVSKDAVGRVNTTLELARQDLGTSMKSQASQQWVSRLQAKAEENLELAEQAVAAAEKASYKERKLKRVERHWQKSHRNFEILKDLANWEKDFFKETVMERRKHSELLKSATVEATSESQSPQEPKSPQF